MVLSFSSPSTMTCLKSKDHQQEETKKYSCLSCHPENCTYNAHHMNHPWWSSHLGFNSMLRRRSRGWWHCHDLRFLREVVSEATISSYNLRNTTIHMLYNIAYMNMCFLSPKHSGNPYIYIGHQQFIAFFFGDLGELPDSRGNDGHKSAKFPKIHPYSSCWVKPQKVAMSSSTKGQLRNNLPSVW